MKSIFSEVDESLKDLYGHGIYWDTYCIKYKLKSANGYDNITITPIKDNYIIRGLESNSKNGYIEFAVFFLDNGNILYYDSDESQWKRMSIIELNKILIQNR